MSTKITILNWNVGGAKYLELEKESKNNGKSRDWFKDKLDTALADLVRLQKPDIVTLQEVAEYEENGVYENRNRVLESPSDYDYLDNILIDTRRHSHQGKWNKVRKLGRWRDESYFGQGNAILIRKDVRKFPIFGLPAAGISYEEWLAGGGLATSAEVAKSSFVEDILLEAGLYLGNRDSEPRAASVVHLVFDRQMSPSNREVAPQDIFVINAHLTTLTMEREGVPHIDREASEKRLRQLGTIFDDTISRYNRWAKEGYRVRGEILKRPRTETTKRHAPLWIIAGDFNFTPDSAEYEYVKRRNFLDLIKDHGLGTKAQGLGKEPTLTVDYAFAGPLFEAIDPHRIVPSLNRNKVQFDNSTQVSDHFPVIATLPFDALGNLRAD